MTNRKNAGTGNDEMGAEANMHGACRSAISAAGGATWHAFGTVRRLEFLISSSCEFC
jgi:hypothetical protein